MCTLYTVVPGTICSGLQQTSGYAYLHSCKLSCLHQLQFLSYASVNKTKHAVRVYKAKHWCAQLSFLTFLEVARQRSQTKWWPTQRTAPWTGIVTLSVEDYIPKSCPDTLRHCYASCIPFVTERLRATCTAAKNRTGCPPCREVTTPHWIRDKAAE